MSSLDDIIAECEKQSEVERITKLDPDPLCLIVRVRGHLEMKQVERIHSLVENCFRSRGVPAPPIIVIDSTIDIAAIPKSMLKE